jgi:hypothetical protein
MIDLEAESLQGNGKMQKRRSRKGQLNREQKNKEGRLTKEGESEG